MFEYLMAGFANVFQPMNLLLTIFGTVVGVVIGCLPGLSGSMGVVDDKAIVEMGVASVGKDAHISRKSIHCALAVNIVADKLVYVSALFTSYAKTEFFAVVKGNVGKGEMMGVCYGKAACKTVAVNVAAFYKQTEIVVDASVIVENRKSVVVCFRLVCENKVHLFLGNKACRRMHIK
ncbi:MAG: hypothetical protein IJ973_07455 [Christensenellaceae bacterium]|nr:hypothetical protein [Christensenellaceae bacterium]